MTGRLSIAITCMCVWASATFSDSFADIRQDLSVLRAELRALNEELVTTRVATTIPDGAIIDRANAIEMELQRVTSRVERLEFRIETLLQTSTQRLDDLDRRLCIADPDCDGASFPKQAGATGVVGDSGVIMTVTEQREFDQAKSMLDNGDPASAIEMFAEFTQAYPGGPITQNAYYLMGQAETELENHKNAARAYLRSYSADPDGVLASDAMFQLSLSFEKLGRAREACVTLTEVETRFPSSAAASAALSAMDELGCE